jgi:hypothetical protein
MLPRRRRSGGTRGATGVMTFGTRTRPAGCPDAPSRASRERRAAGCAEGVPVDGFEPRPPSASPPHHVAWKS